MNTGRLIIIFFLTMILASPLLADGSEDFNDGIEIDELISDAIPIDINRSFIKVSSLAISSNGSRKRIVLGDGDSVTESGAGNINVGPGTDLRGATIINLSENNGVVVSQ